MDDRLDLDERYYEQISFPDGIGLAEYQQAAMRLDAEEKAFLWATSTTSLLAPAIWFFGYQLHIDTSTSTAQQEVLPTVTTVYLLFSILFSIMAILHVANSRRNRVLAERKIVLLRRSMGVKYGRNSLILPSWRLEGADNPFGLPLFAGYFTYSSFPVFLLLSFSALSIALLFDNLPFEWNLSKDFELFEPSRMAVGTGLSWLLCGVLIFRYSLNEQHENLFLWVARIVSFLTRIPLVPNVEYSLYRARLDVSEASRVGAETETIIPFALSVEDGAFYRHRGINWRGVIRALWQFFSRRRISGGSSITQQCARTNFIGKLTPAWRRKIVEFALAKWLESVSSKKEILYIYLTTARFEQGIYGFHRALRHFFPNEPRLDPAISFILIERLGNVRSAFLGKRIEELLRRFLAEGLLTREEIERIGVLYDELIDSEKINCSETMSPIQIVAAINGNPMKAT